MRQASRPPYMHTLIGLMLVTAGGLAGCAANPATGGMDLVMMSEKDEIRLGEESHKQIMKDFRPYPNDALQEYVNGVGQNLVGASERSGLAFHFLVLDDDMVNAFALPGGYVYITRGMLAYLNSEAELAAVLGHEIGHVTGRHAVRQDTTSKLVGVGSVVTGVATGSAAAMDLGSMFGGALVSGYGRQMELEADELGARYMASLKYPPSQMLEVIDILKRREMFEIARARKEKREPEIYHGWFASHPDNDTRLQEAVQAAALVDAGDPNMIRRQVFLEHIDGLTWGKSRAGGVVRGNRYYHRGLRVKFNFPAGWRLESEKNGIAAYSEDSDAAIQVIRKHYAKGNTPRQFVGEIPGLGKVRDGKDITVSELPAFIGIAERAQSPFGLRPLRIAVVFDSATRSAYLFSGSGRQDLSKLARDKDFISTIFSFDKLDYQERKLAEPPVIKVIRMEPGQSIEQLARTSPISGYPAETLRLLNSLSPGEEPRVGDFIKVVE
jgi:predicted Zn-dependent protease